MPYFIEKPWGSEHVIEVNDQYMVKILTMKAGHQCSLQHHVYKRETFLLLKGEMTFVIENAHDEMVNVPMKPGEFFTINPGVKHRMRAITDIEYIECSTPHPDDVVRHSDDYSRSTNN